MKKIKVGSDFSGVGAFNQALKRLGVDYNEVFACDMDKYARKTFIHNYGEPDYYPQNVYDREIPTDSLDIYMTSPPCQAFSLAGKRLGKDDKRGILFFNSHEFIRVNKPRYFIFENVKGLLSDDGGRTFNEWINMLGGKSVNGNAVMFPYDDAVPYHIYWKVLNAKEHGVPQNRERVFIIGVRDDADNTFRFPAEEFLTKRLKDVLEDDVDEKYFLSEKMVDFFITNTEKQKENGNGFKFCPSDGTTIGKAVTCRAVSRMDDTFIQVKSATTKGYEIAEDGDSINYSVPNSETRRERVGKQVAQTLDTGCNQGVVQVIAFGRSEEEKKRRAEHFKKTGKDSGSFKDKKLIAKNQDYYDTILANPNPKKEGLIGQQVAQTLDTGCNQGVVIPLFHYGNGKSNERMVYDSNGISPCMVSAMGMGGGYTPAVMQLNPSKESNGKQPYQQNRVYDSNGICPALNAGQETWGGNAITVPTRKDEQLNDSSDIHNCITEAIGRQGSSKEYIESCKRVNKALEKKYNDKRLNKTIENKNLPDGEPMMLDTYNQSVHEYCPSLKARHAQNNDRRLWTGYSIRRLTPRECFRLMDFPDDFDFSVVSDSQAYKQAGNSIVVNVLYKILKNLNL